MLAKVFAHALKVGTTPWGNAGCFPLKLATSPLNRLACVLAGPSPRHSLEGGTTLVGMASTATIRRIKILVPVVLLTLVGPLAVNVVTADRRPTPAALGASGSLDGGLGRIHGVIPLESRRLDATNTAQHSPARLDGEMHRVRILLELTAMEQGGLTFDPSRYAVSALGAASGKLSGYPLPPGPPKEPSSTPRWCLSSPTAPST